MGKWINDGSLRDSVPTVDFPSYNLLGRPAKGFMEKRDSVARFRWVWWLLGSRKRRGGSGLGWDGQRGGGSGQSNTNPKQYNYGTEVSSPAPLDSDWSSSEGRRQAPPYSDK
ncbi:unnamed protein product [Dovyalis caffra]|uniref:Uncharacterized protein n=1 Tax=Dovyalis caffra TaxID=77055 RepID=A0AAV1R8F6_9ROSI|nr:unnamed protein product [Dovyalis caffra]